jgi:uncharacterized protein (TIGR02001 family)
MPVDALPPIVPAFEITVATQGMSKGLLQSDGVQFVPRLLLKAGKFQAGGQWKNISTNSAKGEASLFAGLAGKAGTFDLNVTASFKRLTSPRGSGNRSSLEFVGGVGRKFGPVALKVTATYSPDDFGGTRQSLYVEGGPSLDLPWQLKASAALGHRLRARNSNYTSFNAGLSRAIGKKLTADVRYYDTDRGELGENFDNRVVGSIKLAI